MTLFTSALCSKRQTCKSFLVVTDSQDKGKDSLSKFTSRLSERITFEAKDTFTIRTDGPTPEFKNKCTSLYCCFQKGATASSCANILPRHMERGCLMAQVQSQLLGRGL